MAVKPLRSPALVGRDAGVRGRGAADGAAVLAWLIARGAKVPLPVYVALADVAARGGTLVAVHKPMAGHPDYFELVAKHAGAAGTRVAVPPYLKAHGLSAMLRKPWWIWQGWADTAPTRPNPACRHPARRNPPVERRATLLLERSAGAGSALYVAPRGPLEQAAYRGAYLAVSAPVLYDGARLVAVRVASAQGWTYCLSGELDAAGAVHWLRAYRGAAEFPLDREETLEQLGAYIDALLALYFRDLAAGQYTLAEFP